MNPESMNLQKNFTKLSNEINISRQKLNTTIETFRDFFCRCVDSGFVKKCDGYGLLKNSEKSRNFGIFENIT